MRTYQLSLADEPPELHLRGTVILISAVFFEEERKGECGQPTFERWFDLHFVSCYNTAMIALTIELFFLSFCASSECAQSMFVPIDYVMLDTYSCQITTTKVMMNKVVDSRV